MQKALLPKAGSGPRARGLPPCQSAPLTLTLGLYLLVGMADLVGGCLTRSGPCGSGCKTSWQ